MDKQINPSGSDSTADNLSNSSGDENNLIEPNQPELVVDMADGKDDSIQQNEVVSNAPQNRENETSARGHLRTATQGSFRFKVSEPDQGGLVKEQIAEVRVMDEAKPMNPLTRKRLKMKRMVGLSGGDPLENAPQDDRNSSQGKMDPKGNNTGDGDAEAAGPDAPVQYQIKSRTRPKINGVPYALQYCGAAAGLSYDPAADSINGPINEYVDWTFRASFFIVFMSMLVGFMLWVTVFAVLLMLAGWLERECIFVSGAEFFDFQKQGSFSDVFQLSWTTFSTVGYGSVFPSTSVQTTAQANCSFVQFLCTVEAFVGVLFAGFCGAILFGKISRVQANAKVVFSGPICIRFGMGADIPDDDDDVKVLGEELFGGIATSSPSSSEEDASIPSTSTGRTRQIDIPCPIMEFRIMNENYKFKGGGAIVDASLSCVSSILHDVPGTHGNTKSIHSAQGPMTKSMRSSTRSSKHRKPRSSARRAFSKLELETSDHPFFERVWVARHVLNESSPLLKPEVAKRIRHNHGFWPADLDSADAVRASLSFSHIIVSFSGVSNFTMSSVYAQKIYDIMDVNVGYQFAPVLYRKEDNALGVDRDMLNDIMEQDGGGAEPILQQ